MALSTATITYDVSDQVGTDFDIRRTKIWVSTNIADGTVIDTVGNAIRVDTGQGTLDAAGTGSVTVWTPGTGSNPDSWQTYVHLDYASPMDRTRKRRTFGPFTVTTAANLADLVEEQEVPAEYLTTITAALNALVDDAETAAAEAEVDADRAEAAADLAVDISGIATPDAVIAAAIANPASDTYDALVDVLTDSLAPVKAATGMELRESFADVANGPAPTVTPTGQTVTNYAVTTPAATPYIRSGFLSTTTPASASYGSYRIAQLDGQVTRAGARFAFTPWSTGGGLLTLSIQNDNIATATPVPVCPIHLAVSPEAWGVDVNNTAGTAVENITAVVFATPLVADSVTLHTVELVLDRDRGQAYLFLPDGNTVTLTDSRFSLPGTYVYVEPYKSAGSLSLKTDALVQEWWADSRGIDDLPAVRALALAARLTAAGPAYVEAYPGSPVTQTLNDAAGPYTVPGCTLSYRIGPSGNTLVVCRANVQVTTAGPVHFWLYDAANTPLAVRTAGQSLGMVGEVALNMTGTVGALQTMHLVVEADDTAVATLRLGTVTLGSANVYAGASLQAIPY